MNIAKTGMMGALMAAAAAVIIFWGVRSLAFILAPLAMAMVITIAILPLPGWFTKKGVKPGLALILTILAVVGVLALVAFITIASIGKLAGYLPSYAANLSTQTSAVEPSSRIGQVSDRAESFVPVINGQPFADEWDSDCDRGSRGQRRGDDVPGALHFRFYAERGFLAPG
jgi:predicted PurR-regulated permease PerM